MVGNLSDGKRVRGIMTQTIKAGAPAWVPEYIAKDVATRSPDEATAANQLEARRENYYRLLHETPAWSEEVIRDLGFNTEDPHLLYFDTPHDERHYPRFQFAFFAQGERAQWPIVSRINQAWLEAGISLDLLMAWWLEGNGTICPALHVCLMPDDQLFELAEEALRSLQ